MRSRFSKVVAVIFCPWAAVLIYLTETVPALAALTQNFAEPTTITLTTGLPGMKLESIFPEDSEQLSTESVVLAETLDVATSTPVLPPLREAFHATGVDGTTLSVDLGAFEARLPVRANRSTTAAQAMQLLRFERRNQIAEAFLLARDLVAREPGNEFALDAAIRTSLILGRTADLELLYRQAIQRARLPGKYHVQLAHWYLRTGQDEKLRDLVSTFEKDASRDGEYYLTLTRLRIISEQPDKARQAVDEAIARNKSPLLFPLVMLATYLGHENADSSSVAQRLQEGAQQDFGPWEHRAQLLEYLKLRNLTAEGVLTMADAALVNEPNYRRARILADQILNRALEERIFYRLRTLLLKKILEDDASDMERWLAALMYEQQGDSESYLRLLSGGLPEEIVLTSSTLATTDSLAHHEEEAFMGGTTPVIAFERALALARAGRHEESLALAANLLAEQPAEWMIRLHVAEQQYLLLQCQSSLQTITSWPLRREIGPELRLRRMEIATSAVLGLASVADLVQTWAQLTANASFDELQRSGEVLMRFPSGGTSATVAADLRDQVEEHLQHRAGNKTDSVLLLRAFLAARENDSRAELQLLLNYLEQAPENLAYLRHVAARAAHHANVALELQGRPENRLLLRATDSELSEVALTLYRRVIELQPRAASAYAHLIRLHMMRGETETARRVAAELAERDSSSPQALALAASLLQENGFAADALVYYRQLIPQSPDDYDLVLRYAIALRAAGKPELAENILHKLLEDGLGNRSYAQGKVLRMLGEIATENGRLSELAEYLDSLRRRVIPDKPAYLLRAAHLMNHLRMPDRALAMLEELIQAWPDSLLVGHAIMLKARLSAAQENTSMAEQAYRSLLEKHTTSSEALPAARELADLLRHNERSEEAVQLLEEIASAHPQRDSALALLLRAAEIAEQDLNDVGRCGKLLTQIMDEECQDFTTRTQAEAALKRLSSTDSSP